VVARDVVHERAVVDNPARPLPPKPR